MSLMSNQPPRISVIIASIVGAPFIDECLLSLEKQAGRWGAEIIVVACGDVEYAGRIAEKFKWVRVIHHPERETVPELRYRGVEAAAGEIFAVIEEHCLAAPDWLERVIAGHAAGDYGAVGGPILDHGYRRVRDWVVYFLEYNGYLPPWDDRDVHDLNGANIAYRKDVLLRYKELLRTGYWEASAHPRMLADGVKFRSVAAMAVHHRGPFNYGYYLQQRYWFSRAFAGWRGSNVSAGRNADYLLIAPLVPLILLARMTQRVFEKRCHIEKFMRAVPLLIPALTVYVAGECVGYVAGPGDALSKVE